MPVAAVAPLDPTTKLPALPLKEPETLAAAAAGQVQHNVTAEVAENESPQRVGSIIDEAVNEAASKIHRTETTSFRNASGFRRNGDLRLYLSEQPDDDGSWDLWRWKIAVFMDHWLVKTTLTLLIISNAIVIGLEADYGDGSITWTVLECIFLFAFTLELTLNLVGYGRLFLTDAWNTLDFVVVIFSIVDFIISNSGGGASTGLSVVRLVRIIRVIRVISFLDKLVYLVSAFMKGMMSAGWVFVLMILAMYIFAVLGKSFFGDSGYLTAEVSKRSGGDVDINELFGSIPKSFLTLVQFLTFDDALGVQRAIADVYPVTWIYFFAFLMLVAIGMMELLASLFIDSLLEEKKMLEQKKQLEKAEMAKELSALITGLFNEFDGDNDGQLTQSDLSQVLEFLDKPSTKNLLLTLGVEPLLLKESIRVADIDGNGTVDRKELEIAIESIHQPPTKADMRDLSQRVLMRNRKVEDLLLETSKVLNDRVDAVDSKVAAIDGRLNRMEMMLKILVSAAGHEQDLVEEFALAEASPLAQKSRRKTLPPIESPS